MPHIKPTVGRVVWYYPPNGNKDDQPHAALVAHVYGDTLVSLACFDATGGHYKPKGAVPLVQDGTKAPPGGNYCTWMPYQINKAHEEAARDALVPQKKADGDQQPKKADEPWAKPEQAKRPEDQKKPDEPKKPFGGK